ncbi:BMP family protein [Sphaerochaeta sp. S2]|uniref:BMP family lipoprotein n=1 Tax=Sphaerochaeta sp. S2 TaxID=2798868 RepID=UPI0018EA2A05|nr:BMP family ABC transporter substrate-binding protein [Sphaerochaeta sp. S2]MBJ2356155.1 BMP family ABC transporter substrate-binding protein [Sphaerochaeta sp. S2]
MKKFVGFIAMVLIAGLLFAAGSAEATSQEAGLNIAIITTPSGVDDGSFNQDNYNGILAFIDENPEAQVTAIREPSGDVAAALKTAADVVAEYDVLVCTGFQFAGIGELAKENPETKFILVDTYPTDAVGNTVELPNVYAMTFAEQESGFFAGVAAALETKTNKVAVVNGVAYPSNVNYQYGFESGVIYANKKLGTNAELVELASQAGTDVTGANVGGNYVGSFADEATGKVIGQQLLGQGVDIVFVAAGASGNGVFTAAKESDGKLHVIGCDVDQWDDGKVGNDNIILTSVLKVMSLNVHRALSSIQDGTFVGANVLLKADTDSTGFVKENGRHQLSASTIEKLDEAYKLVQDGTLVPASNFGGFTPEGFKVN